MAALSLKDDGNDKLVYVIEGGNTPEIACGKERARILEKKRTSEVREEFLDSGNAL